MTPLLPPARKALPGSLARGLAHPLCTPSGLFILALALRLYGITHESLWIDESATLRRAQLSPGELLENCAVHGQLPLYYLMMHYWVSLAGSGELALRLPSALFGGLNVLLAYLAIHRFQHDHRLLAWPLRKVSSYEPMKRATGARRRARTTPSSLSLGPYRLSWPLVGALVVATQPLLIYFGQEARTYTLMLVLTWLVVLTLLVPLYWQRPPHRYETLVLGLCLSLLVLDHYIGWVMGTGSLLVYLWHLRSLDRKAQSGAPIPSKASGRGARPKGKGMDRDPEEELEPRSLPGIGSTLRLWSPLPAYLLPMVLWLIYLFHSGDWPNQEFHQGSGLSDTLGSWSRKEFAPALLLQLPLLVAGVLGLRLFQREGPTTARACLLGIVGLPLVVVLGGAWTRNYFSARYFLPIMVPLLLLAGRGLMEEDQAKETGRTTGTWRRRTGTWRRTTRTLRATPTRGPSWPRHPGTKPSLLLVILLLALTQTAWQASSHLKPQWREAAQTIDEGFSDGELVAVAPRWERQTLNYYLESGRALTLDQITARMAAQGQDLSLPGLWVVYRSDTADQRQEFHGQVSDQFTFTRVAAVKSLQVYHYLPTA